MKLKYANYEAILIHEDNSRTSLQCDFAGEALRYFQKSKAVKMLLFQATHNNTRLKKFAVYGPEFK